MTDVKVNTEILARNAQIAGMMDIEDIGDIKELRQQVANSLGITLDELLESAEPMEAIYIIADHTRCLAFMLADGIIPSNVKRRLFGPFSFKKNCPFHERIKHERVFGRGYGNSA